MPTRPGDTYPRRAGIDIENYRFELALSDTTDEIRGRATITVRFTAEAVAELMLDLAGVDAGGKGMTVDAVVATSTGRPLRFEHKADLLEVHFAEPGRSGSRTDVTIDYHGVPGAGLRIGPNRYGERTFFSDNWPNRARAWLPTIDHVYDKATCAFVVTAPAHYQVVSNGLLVEETDRADGSRSSHWRQSVPISPWLYTLGVARFAVQVVDDFQGRPIQTWVYAKDRDAGFHDFAVPTKQALAFYSEYVGPFAYEKLANVQSPAAGGGMEAATAIMYHESAVTGERTTRWRNVIIHEVAHQWFGNAVTEADWDDVWLSEGFATYFTLLFIEHAYGRDEFVAGLESAADRVWAWYAEHPDYRIVHDGLDDMSRVTSIATYQKGAWILHMLRKRMGEDAFWMGIRAYYAAHFNGSATTADFRRAMEEASGQDLEAFFGRWLREGGNPRLRGSWSYDPDAKALTVQIEQVQESGLFPDLPLEVGIYGAGDALPRAIHVVHFADRALRAVIPVDGAPADVRLDPNRWALFQGDFRERRD
jgi:aminopeptidase N